jgi:hypothetical protein
VAVWFGFVLAREGGKRQRMVQRRDGRAATVVVTKARRKVPGWANSRLKNLEVGIFWWKEKELANGLHKDLGRD